MLLRILTFLAVCQVTTSHKILMFSPTASKSHMISQGRIADELANAGHEVVNFEPDFLNLTDKFVPCKKCRRWPVTGLNNYKFKKIQNGEYLKIDFSLMFLELPSNFKKSKTNFLLNFVPP